MKDGIFDLSYPFIERCIDEALNDNLVKFRKESDLSNMYFVGATLCIDTKDELGTSDILLLSLNEQTVYSVYEHNFVSRRLLPISIIKKMKKLYDECEVKYNPINWLN